MPSTNRRDFLQRLTLALLAGVSGTLRAQNEPRAYDQRAYDRLRNVDLFAFGGVGFAANTSNGELGFRILLRQEKQQTLAQLEKLYAEGNPQAKAYALAGIHTLNPQRFSELYAALPNVTVKTAHGCILSRDSLESVAKEIALGAFDKQLH